jgi:hypothetical protein
MAANTSKGITYPTSGDSVAPLETVFATLASTTNTALGQINAGTDITAGTLPITRGGTGGTTQATAQSALGVVALSSYFAAGKNAIINGAFDVWQRATTSTSTTASGYFADRWRYSIAGGTSKAFTQSQQSFAAGSAPVAGYEGKTFLRVAVTAGGSGYTAEVIDQPIEDVRTLANTTVTISFWAKTTSSPLNFTPRLVQYFGVGGSADVTTNGTSISVTSVWARFTQTLTVPSIAGKTIVDPGSALIFGIVPGTLNSIYTLDLWGVQIEQGSVATNFVTATETIANEIALCQRYYYRTSNTLTATVPFGAGMQFSASIAWVHIKFPQRMRVAPTALEASAAATFQMVCTAGTSATAVAFGSANDDGGYISLTVAGTGGQGGIGRFTGTAATAFLGFSAEL